MRKNYVLNPKSQDLLDAISHRNKQLNRSSTLTRIENSISSAIHRKDWETVSKLNRRANTLRAQLIDPSPTLFTNDEF